MKKKKVGDCLPQPKENGLWIQLFWFLSEQVFKHMGKLIILSIISLIITVVLIGLLTTSIEIKQDKNGNYYIKTLSKDSTDLRKLSNKGNKLIKQPVKRK